MPSANSKQAEFLSRLGLIIDLSATASNQQRAGVT